MNRALALLLLTLAAPAVAFESGSTGVDGPLVYTVGDGSPRVEVFDPAVLVPPRDVDGDGVYHFTTITIPANVTVRLSADRCGYQPLFWLASGAVDIAGTIDLSGEDPVELPAGTVTMPTVPGPGGFPGGEAARSAELFGGPGYGPGGGQFAGTAGSHATDGFFAWGVAPVGSAFLIPLLGGSGGAGSSYPFGQYTTVFAGGAGGGALLIASNTSIIVDGRIDATGGRSPGRAGFPDGANGGGGFSGDGAGGAVRLVAPRVAGGGAIVAGTDDFRFHYGGQGRIRIDAAADEFTGALLGDARRVTLHPTTPLGLPGQISTPRLRVVRVGGRTVPQRPGGGLTAADVSLADAAPVLFEIEGADLPLDATVTLHLFGPDGPLLVVTAEPLQGTATASTTTASAVLPAGFLRGFAVANWSAP